MINQSFTEHLQPEYNQEEKSVSEIILQGKKQTTEILNIDNIKIGITLGRSIENSLGTVQNVQVYLNNELIIDSDDKNRSNGYMYLVINYKDEKIRIATNNKNDERYIMKNQAYVGDISLPKKYQGKGIGKKIYQAVADALQVEIIRGDEISLMSQRFRKKHTSFKPNQEESI